jgi:hypothetical protein
MARSGNRVYLQLSLTPEQLESINAVTFRLGYKRRTEMILNAVSMLDGTASAQGGQSLTLRSFAGAVQEFDVPVPKYDYVKTDLQKEVERVQNAFSPKQIRRKNG